MPYCRKCGAKIEENDRFCPKCGAPSVTYSSQTPQVQSIGSPEPIRKDPIIFAGMALIVILVVAVVVAVFLMAPLGNWNVNQTFTDRATNVHTLNLNFGTDIGHVSVTALKVADSNVAIYIIGNGSKGAFGGGNNPISVSFENTTSGDVLTVNSNVNVERASSMNTNLGIRIFVDPALTLNLNVTSHAGQVSFLADKPSTLGLLDLSTNAGTVDSTIQNVTLTGPIVLNTNAGTINYRMNNVNVEGNRTLSLHSNAGSVHTDITQTQSLGGNLQVNANTDLGSIDLTLVINGDVGAKITSQASLGSVHINNANNFSGDRSSLQSNNYPATNNIEVDCHTNVGSINIDADNLNDQGSTTIRN